MKLYKRGGMAAIALAGAALVAAGCGGSGGGSGASGAATDSKALDLVPKDAIGYATFDTDFDGDNWKQFDHLATAFQADYKGTEDELAEELNSGDDKVDYKKDVDPWLGDSAGVALLRVNEEGEDADFFVWADLDDRAKFEKFAKKEGGTPDSKIGDWKTFKGDSDSTDDTYIAYSDDLVIVTTNRKLAKSVVEYDGDSITDAEGVKDAVDETGDDALATFVLSGEGAREALKDVPQLESVAKDKRLEDFQSLAVSVSAEDEGMRVSGFAGADGEDAPENVENEVFTDLPANTVFAVGGSDFGGGLKNLVEEAGKDNAQVQQAVGAGAAALGVTVDDLAKAFDGDFAIAMSADDAGLGSLAGGVAGAAMGGGLSNVDPSSLAKSASIVLAFEETGKTSDTLGKLAGSVGGLTGATSAPKTGTAGDFETQTLSVAGFPVTTAKSDDVAAISLGADVFNAWGDESLGDSDVYKDAWKAADAPDKAAGNLWFDAGRVAKLADVDSADDVELGGLVGWIEGDGSNAKFGMFLHVQDK